MRDDTMAQARGHPFVYYARGGELVLATPERTIARHRGTYTGFGFTHDNSRIYALDGAGGLTSFDVAAGAESHRFDCHCTKVFPLAGASVGWWQPDGFADTDLSSPKPIVPKEVRMSPPRDPLTPGNTLSGPQLLAAHANGLILDLTEAPPGVTWAVNHLFHIDTATGAARELGRVEDVNMPLVPGAFRSDGREAAFIGHTRDGSTCGRAHLVSVQLPEGRIDTQRLPVESTCSAITDLRWAGATVIATGLMWEPTAPERLTGTEVWTRTGGQWDRRGDTATLRYGPLTPQVTLRVQRTGTEGVHAVQSGDLVLSSATETRVLAHDVVDVRLPGVLP
ncbi:hypothetical protein ACFYTQ_19520 [Nocardia sp. NPDC004068]|uniref:hypothetical protein n=1 Tax=Nocardia sp. NPDC004068 TaxID=3364303 RepID=UPI0036BB1C3E